MSCNNKRCIANNEKYKNHCNRMEIDPEKCKLFTSDYDCCYESVTIMLLRIIDFMHQFQVDVDVFKNEFLPEITDYEIKLAEREGIKIHD